MSKAKVNIISDLLDEFQVTTQDIRIAIEQANEAITTVTAHVDAIDPHTQYFNQTRGDARYIKLTDIGQPDGVASLNSSGVIPTSQLPSFVDDVEEYADLASFPVTGENGKIYVALDTNKAYRWGGSTYVYITSGAVDSVNSQTGVVVLDTDDVAEGVNNLYYTDTRASNAAPIQTVYGRTGDIVAEAGDYTASLITFDNTSTGLTATDVQNAVVEVSGGLDDHTSAIDPHPQYTTVTEAASAAPVQSVNGQTGNVSLDFDNYNGWELLVNSVSQGNISSAEVVNFVGSGNVTITYSASNNTLTFDSVDLNYYLDGLTFDAGTGSITASVSGATNQVVNIDGRYIPITQSLDQDLNTVTQTGLYRIGGTSVSNQPTGATTNGSTLLHITYDSNAAHQMYFEHNTNATYKRRKSGGAWGAWVRLYDDNYKPIVDLASDAELLDGQEGAFYQDASNLNAGILPSARFDDTSHGNRGGGSLHAVATQLAAGFMSATDKTKLDGIESGAQVNTVDTVNGQTGTVVLDSDDVNEGLNNLYFTQDRARDSISVGGDLSYDNVNGVISFSETYSTPLEIKTAYESNTDTNAYTDSERAKLAAIEDGAQANTVDTVNGQTGNVVLDTDDVQEATGATNLWYTDTRVRNALSASGDLSYDPLTGDFSFSETYSTPAELLTAILTVDGSTSGLDADQLDGQEGSYYLNYNNFTNVPAFDNYQNWNLLVDNVAQDSVTSGENVNFVGGNNVLLSYSPTDNTITIDSEGGIDWGIVSANTTAQAGNGYLVDSSAGPVIVTLPSSPVEGDTVGIADYTRSANTNNITIARNGSNIFGLIEDLVINIDGAGLTLVYTDANRGWELVSEIGIDRNKLLYTVDGNGGSIVSDEVLKLVSGTNVTIDSDPVTDTLTFNAVDTTYTAGTGITLTGTTFSLTDESYTSAEKTKLAGIEAGAQVNTVDSVNTQTGAVVLDTDDVGEGISNLYFTDQRAINAIQGDASWNATDWDTAFSWGDHSLAGYELASNKGIAGGYASLDANAKIPTTQLPSFVDDVEEYTNFGSFPTTGEQGKIYIALDTNKAYRWSGSTYVYITSGAVDSVNGATGVVVLDSGDIAEGTNLYFTETRARNSISVTGDLSYNASTGVISFSETYSTPLEIKTAYESNADTNAFTDAEQSKLAAIESGAQVNTVDTVNGQTGTVVLDTDDISEATGALNLWFTNTRARNAISATGDISYNASTGVISFSETYSTPTELLTAIKTVDGAGSGLDADLLDGQSGAYYLDFNNFTNVPTYDNYVNWSVSVDGSIGDDITSGENLNFISGANVSLTQNTTNNSITVDAVDTTYTAGAGITLTGTEFSLTDESYTLTEKNKLAGIEAGAEVNTVDTVNGQTGSVVLDTDDINESTGALNLWYTDTRARNAISATGDISYNASTGVISFNETYSTANELLTAIKTVDGSTSGLDADFLDGQDGSYYLNWNNFTNVPTYDNYVNWNLLVDGVSQGAISSNENVNFVGGESVELSYNATDNTITIDSVGGIDWSIVSANTTAQKDNGYLVDVSTGPVTLTLPASPVEGDTIGIADYTRSSATNNITVARNGNNIFGLTEDLIINIDGAGLTLVYTNATVGWELVSEIGLDRNDLNYTVDGTNGNTIVDTETLDFASGNNVSIVADNVNNRLTFNAVDTTYTAGAGITLSGTTFSLTDESYTLAEKNKLAGIEAGAEVNTVDSVNTQTGAVVLDTDDVGEGIANLYYTQARFDSAFGAKSTTDLSEGTNLYFTDARAISAIQNDVSWNATNWDTAYSWGDHSVAGYELASNKGVANGYASLDSGGKVPSSQLPSFVDDVEEYTNFGSFPTTGESSKLYVALDTNKVYRWSGSNYIYITSGAVDSVNGQTGVVVLDTGDVAEGTNLYYTQARFDSAFAAKSTTDLSEGTNLYYTDTRVRNAISVSGDLSYNATTGEISFSETYSTPLEVKTAYESNADTNAFTDAEKTKLSNIEAGAQVNTVDTVNGQTGTVVLDTDDVQEATGALNLWYTDTRARNAISVTGDLTYNASTGVIGFNETYSTANELLTALTGVDGSGSGLDADLLDGQQGSYYLDWTNVTNKPDPTITLTGDVTGNTTLTDLASGTISTIVGDDSHNHTTLNNVTDINYADGISDNTASLTTTATTQATLASFDALAYGSSEIVIQASSGSSRHITKLLVVHDGVDAFATEYGVVATNGDLFTVDVVYSTGDVVEVLVTPVSSTSTNFRAKLSNFEV